MVRCIFLVMLLSAAMSAEAQERKEQNKPYIDLRPLHFGILVGIHLQDVELDNVGPQMFVADDGTESMQTVVCDADKWNPGFSVGVLAEARLHQHFAVRFSPTMHFGAKHLKFINMSKTDAEGKQLTATQDLKNTYISFPLDLKFSAQRFNNYRPYLIAGINPMINLTGKASDYVRLKRFDTMIEVGLGCDFYLPYFKLNPELKFCYSLTNSLDTENAENFRDENLRPFAKSVSSAHAKMVVLTFYFE